MALLATKRELLVRETHVARREILVAALVAVSDQDSDGGQDCWRIT